MNTQSFTLTAPSARWSYLWLAIGAILLVFSNGRWIIPLATWLAPVFLMRFVRTQKPVRGLILGALTHIAATTMYWQGMVPVPVVALYFLITGGYGLIFFLPYVADRLLTPRLKGLAATLVFPLAWVTVEYANSLANPYGTWASLAYTQYGNLPLVQLVSVTGLWGLSFLITWFASVVNWAWEQGFDWPRVRLGVGLYVGILGAVLLFGSARVALFPPEADTVRVASLTPSRDLLAERQKIFDRFVSGEPMTDAQWESGRALWNTILDDLVERSQLEARAGAKIVVWPEGAASMWEEDEMANIERGRELARQEGVYLQMALGSIPPDFPNSLIGNKLIMIDPSGKILWEYFKAKPVPGEPVVPGDGIIPTADTPYGRVAAVICFDMDFHALIRQAGQARVDLLLAPSADWKDIDRLHTQMATFRAVENGFSLARHTSNGLAIAVDYQGQVLATSDFFTTDPQVMVAHLPMKGVRTIYSVVGDLFAWLCVAGFLALVGWVVVQRKVA